MNLEPLNLHRLTPLIHPPIGHFCHLGLLFFRKISSNQAYLNLTSCYSIHYDFNKKSTKKNRSPGLTAPITDQMPAIRAQKKPMLLHQLLKLLEPLNSLNSKTLIHVIRGRYTHHFITNSPVFISNLCSFRNSVFP